MQKWTLCLLFTVLFSPSFAQGVGRQLQAAVNNLEGDAQLKHAVFSLLVVDSKTGNVVFDKNAQVGLAPASCQKVITSVAALEMLGPAYRYKTLLSYDGTVERGVLNGNLYITGSGDPTLGSPRWNYTAEQPVLQAWINEVKAAGIKKISGRIIAENLQWEAAAIPDGWIWQDIGNYYGAGASFLNWRENQYDVKLRSGDKSGDTCSIVSIVPAIDGAQLISEVRSAEKGSGDNAYIYLPPYASLGYIRGTIPAGEKAFTISGSFPDPASQLKKTFADALIRAGTEIIPHSGATSSSRNKMLLSTMVSPPLDSINYWFLKKSINLYGEALIKTIAREKSATGSTVQGVDDVKEFWNEHGIEKSAINIADGSGLSPQNRVTADALVQVMQYARTRPWFSSFRDALPVINGIPMKSGSIGGARSYTGYITSKNGVIYTFAFIVNNYDGSTAEILRKMWRVLDVLK